MLTNTNKVMLAITGYHFPQITRTDQKVSYRLKKNIFPGFSGRNKISVLPGVSGKSFKSDYFLCFPG